MSSGKFAVNKRNEYHHQVTGERLPHFIVMAVVVFCCFVELISCTQHLSIKSDIISSSPLEFDLFEEDATAEEEGNKKKSADYSITLNPETSGDDDYAWSCCDECEERERFALHDSPPILVQTGNTATLLICCNSHFREPGMV